MNSELLLSICIPTNGVEQWVFPVLDSIYSQGVEESRYEVVVMDNGNNEHFGMLMQEYAAKHTNLNYKKTEAKLFLSEIACYQQAKGAFIKFLNHRTMLRPGTLEYFLSFVEQNSGDKPVVYFADGTVKLPQDVCQYDSFDGFVGGLMHMSSWSTGMGFWKDDFQSIPPQTVFNELFPHTTILFDQRKRSRYIIDNRVLLDTIPVGNIPKGKYDLFHAFAVEYPAIISDLLRSGDISVETFLRVKKSNLRFIAGLYYDYVIRKRKCSYDLSSYDTSIKVFYGKFAVNYQMLLLVIGKLYNKIKKLLFKQ